MSGIFFVQDLKNAKSVVDWIAWAEPQYDFNPVIDEWCKEAPKELDFNREAGKILMVFKIVVICHFQLKLQLVSMLSVLLLMLLLVPARKYEYNLQKPLLQQST